MKGKDLRIVFLGTPDFAVMPLQALVENGYNVVGVVTVPDKPAGRGLQLRESPVKKYALSVGLPLLQPEKLRDEQFLARFRDWEPDLGIVIAFRMLPEEVFAAPKYGTFNLHASLLPDYRGAAPINRAIMNGETMTGVTTFFLNAGIDTGDIIGSATVPVDGADTAGTLHDKLMAAGVGLVLQTVEQIADGTLELCPQPQVDVPKPAPKIFREDCYIHWDRPIEEIYNHIRGLSPYPAAWGYLVARQGTPCVTREVNTEGEDSRRYCPSQDNLPEDTVQVKIYKARMEYDPHPGIYGYISTDGKSVLKVACNGGYMVIEELQVPGKKRMPTAEFLRGFKEIFSFSFV